MLYLQVFARVFAIGGKSVDTELEWNNFNYSDIFSLETRLTVKIRNESSDVKNMIISFLIKKTL